MGRLFSHSWDRIHMRWVHLTLTWPSHAMESLLALFPSKILKWCAVLSWINTGEALTWIIAIIILLLWQMLHLHSDITAGYRNTISGSIQLWVWWTDGHIIKALCLQWALSLSLLVIWPILSCTVYHSKYNVTLSREGFNLADHIFIHDLWRCMFIVIL